jgi:hypothetical protein
VALSAEAELTRGEVFWVALPYSIKYLSCPDWKGRCLKCAVSHVPRDNPIVLSHALDHVVWRIVLGEIVGTEVYVSNSKQLWIAATLVVRNSGQRKIQWLRK